MSVPQRGHLTISAPTSSPHRGQYGTLLT